MAPRLTRLSVLVSMLLFGRAAHAVPAAEELVLEAREHEASREVDVALRRYAEALSLDPTLGDAYLGLGALRLRLGDAREAERVYEAALSHLPGLTRALLGRGEARRAAGDRVGADADLEAYVAAVDDPEALRELSHWYAEEARPVAELAAFRRLLSLAERAKANGSERKDARLTVRALELIVGDADPVRRPPGPASPTRRGMARIEQRR